MSTEYTAGGLPADGPRQFVCPDCGYRITVGLDGTEYGHFRGLRQDQDRCPRRPTSVDPTASASPPVLSDDEGVAR